MLAENVLLQEVTGLKKFAIKLCGNDVDADDLLQTTLLKALDNREKFITDGPAFSWLSRIMFNTHVTNRKKRNRYETQYDPEPFLALASTAHTQEDQVMMKEVQEAMNKIKPAYKEILMMICAMGLSYEEAAAQLGIPMGTVRSRLSRARDTLQQVLATNDNNARAAAPVTGNTSYVLH